MCVSVCAHVRERDRDREKQTEKESERDRLRERCIYSSHWESLVGEGDGIVQGNEITEYGVHPAK